MKKLYGLIIVVMFFTQALTIAEESYISEMSTDELMELRTAIDLEISKRAEASDTTASSIPLPEGYYVVGKDISAGSYNIEDVSSPDAYKNSMGWSIILFSSENEFDEYNNALREYESAYMAYISDEELTPPDQVYLSDYASESMYLGVNSTCRISLKEGEVLGIVGGFSEGDLIISETTGLFMD